MKGISNFLHSDLFLPLSIKHLIDFYIKDLNANEISKNLKNSQITVAILKILYLRKEIQENLLYWI